MKEIAEKYSKAWELFWTDLPVEIKGAYRICDDEYEIPLLFGYLVLEFFPKHGITIDLDWIDVYRCRFEVWFGNRYVDGFETFEEAIEKAFEILENRLKGK